MAHINRKYIDKHWLVSVLRGGIAMLFGFILLFKLARNINLVIAGTCIFLLVMGVFDSVSALYASVKKHGWINSVVDAVIDVLAAVVLLFFAKNDIVASFATIAIYTFVSGIVDIFHSFLSTIDPTDRFLKILIGILGCVIGLVILNAGEFEIMTVMRFFGVYMLLVGTISMAYGIHNRSQEIEDKVARKEAAKKKVSKKSSKKSSGKHKK